MLPERLHKVSQVEGSNLCGWFVLAWCEDEAAEHAGSGPACLPLPSFRLKALRQRLANLTKGREAELLRQAEEEKEKEDKYQKQLSLAKKKAEALAAEEPVKKAVAVAALQAAKLVAEGGHIFTEADLSAQAKEAINKVEATGLGICSRCRWSSGCLSCSVEKAKRFWLQAEGRAWVLKRMAEL